MTVAYELAPLDIVRTARRDHEPGTKMGGCECCFGSIKASERYARLSAPPGSEHNSGDRWLHLKIHYPECPPESPRWGGAETVGAT